MSLYLNFRETLQILGDTPKSFKILPVKLNSYLEISVIFFLFKFKLDVDSFGSRRIVDDSEVISATALVLNSPANLLFLYRFFLACYSKFRFSATVVVYWTG